MTENPWMNQPDVDPFDDMPSQPLKSYADPVANAEVQRLRAKVRRVVLVAADLDGMDSPAASCAAVAILNALADREETK